MKVCSSSRNRSGDGLRELFLEQARRVDTGTDGHRGVLLRVGCERSLEGSPGDRDYVTQDTLTGYSSYTTLLDSTPLTTPWSLRG